MNRTLTVAATLVAVAALAGCGSASTTTTASTKPSLAPSSTAPDAMAGMVMSDASTAKPDPAQPAKQGKPTPTQAMVCGDEIKGDVKQVLKLKTTPPTRSTYADALFTCTYTLSVGQMRLSVKHSATNAAALSYAQDRRKAVAAGQDAAGLTDHAYQSGTGVVLVVKDNEVLEVDTTSLPKVFGVDHQGRSDLAYELASDVLGCWTGDDS